MIRSLARHPEVSLRILAAVGALVGVPVALLSLSPYGKTNCGGNSDALSAVGGCAIMFRCAAADSPDHELRVASLTAGQRARMTELPRLAGHPHARLLVSTAPVPDQSTDRRIIIVCDTPYTNVPQRWFGSNPPTYAAGLADGRSRLITPAEFAALDWASFVPLEEVLPAASPAKSPVAPPAVFGEAPAHDAPRP